jgi:OOP family OmpA-OmpF porin
MCALTKERALNKGLVWGAIAGVALVSGDALADPGDWYVAPSIVYADDDPDRAVEDGVVGFQIQAGYDFSDSLTFEGLIGYNDWESFLDTPTARYPDQAALDLSANMLYYFNRDMTFAPYLLVGVGYLNVDRSPGNPENNPSATAGVGFDWRMGRSNFSIRGEVRARHAFDFCSADCQSRTDYIASVGLQYRFGGQPDLPAPNADSDLDGVLDTWDECPNTPRGTQVSASGCPLLEREGDADGDRIPDSQDQCPNTPAGAAVNPQGCSLDSDMDGVPTDRDRCPSSRPNAKVDVYGCEVDTDTDNDGVLNDVDSCPGTPQGARVDIYGCEITDVINLPGLSFETDSDRILPGAEWVLMDAARTLQTHRDLVIEVAGHTDNVGNENWNIGLSLRRAYTVRDFLVSQGVAPERISARGYGSAQPIADNVTAEGRAQNRRVELRVIEQN